jgi:hypothetical protein
VELQVGVEVEESRVVPLPGVETRLDDSGFLDYAVAGTQVAGEFRCAECGYGAVIRHLLPPCPMCAGTVWESRG